MSVRVLLLIAAGVIVVVSIPLILKVMPRSSRYGLRTPLTLSSDELWFRANYFAGWASVIAAAVSTTAFGFIAQDMAHWVAFLGMAAVAAAGGLVVWFHVKETRPATYID